MDIYRKTLDRLISCFIVDATLDAKGNIVEKPVNVLIPSDLLWLLNHTGRGSGNWFGVITNSVRSVVQVSAEPYTKIITALIEQRLESDVADIQYSNILEVADLVPLEPYKSTLPAVQNWGR